MTISVPSAAAPARLDVFLQGHIENLSRRAAQQRISAGAIRVNGRLGRKSMAVAAGDVIEIDDDALADGSPTPNAGLAVPVAFESGAVLALDKPAGMPTHANDADEVGTVANFLAARYPECLAVSDDPWEAGIAHRLDNDTSGLLLVARTPEAYRGLRGQFAARSVTKEYLALVHDIVSEPGEVRRAIAHDRRRAQRMRLVDRGAPGAQAADTTFRPIQRFRGFSLLAVRIGTGVRHQIRLHLSAIGHPLVGDFLYGAPETDRRITTRHLLHACYLEFRHPEVGTSVEVRSEMPRDFLAAVRRVEGYRQRRR